AKRDPSLLSSQLNKLDKAKQKLLSLKSQTRKDLHLQLLTQIENKIAEFQQDVNAFVQSFQNLLAINKKRAQITDEVNDQLQKMLNELSRFTTDRAEGIVAQLSTSSQFAIWGMLIALVLGILISLWIIRSIESVLTTTTEALSQSATQVSSAAQQVSSSSQSLAEGASEQAASLEETSASLEQIASMTKRNAENALSAKELASQTRSAAESGTRNMEEMNRAMADIQSSSDNISKIIKTIDEIAFQTNILALNAAVEAARAGEAGAGFAVVADEVRSLAQRAAQAARETAERIEDNIRKSATGVELSNRVAQSLQEIVSRVRQMDELVAEIATASREQSQGIEQVNSAVTQMDKVTQQNAAAAEESASASEQMNAQAATLHDLVQQLEKLVSGRSAKATASRQTPAKALDFVSTSPDTSGRKFKATNKKPSSLSAQPHPHRLASTSSPSSDHPKLTPPKSEPKKKKPEEEIPLDEGFKDF
ncbi:MAG: methyl-accepting chemotaxis protein, partial [Chthoniobacterales bacterium]|nr:methyl-accepting chemotaxis protein [Chthoniobacterales bacterium]